jgi:isoleucyl-tRNA synthetase
VRGAVTRTLEPLRQRGEIRHSLEAHVALEGTDGLGTLLADHRDRLAELFIVSQVDIVAPGTLGDGTDALPGLRVAARRVGGTRCPRCWTYKTDVGSNARFPELCGRCAGVLATAAAAS